MVRKSPTSVTAQPKFFRKRLSFLRQTSSKFKREEWIPFVTIKASAKVGRNRAVTMDSNEREPIFPLHAKSRLMKLRLYSIIFPENPKSPLTEKDDNFRNTNPKVIDESYQKREKERLRQRWETEGDEVEMGDDWDRRESPSRSTNHHQPASSSSSLR